MFGRKQFRKRHGKPQQQASLSVPVRRALLLAGCLLAAATEAYEAATFGLFALAAGGAVSWRRCCASASTSTKASEWLLLVTILLTAGLCGTVSGVGIPEGFDAGVLLRKFESFESPVQPAARGSTPVVVEDLKTGANLLTVCLFVACVRSAANDCSQRVESDTPPARNHTHGDEDPAETDDSNKDIVQSLLEWTGLKPDPYTSAPPVVIETQKHPKKLLSALKGSRAKWLAEAQPGTLTLQEPSSPAAPSAATEAAALLEKEIEAVKSKYSELRKAILRLHLAIEGEEQATAADTAAVEELKVLLHQQSAETADTANEVKHRRCDVEAAEKRRRLQAADAERQRGKAEASGRSAREAASRAEQLAAENADLLALIGRREEEVEAAVARTSRLRSQKVNVTTESLVLQASNGDLKRQLAKKPAKHA
ncbi:hypothetical protein DIPPA_31474 [Diplonema papillatum]|nr:hypothetical protein DIPPA_31474 [Diplonema papillatum]